MEKILLHACCGPCSIAPIESIRKNSIEPTLYFFNPNIHNQTEYLLRLEAFNQVVNSYQCQSIVEGNKNYYHAIGSNNKQLKNVNYFKQALKQNIPNFELLSTEKWQKSLQNIVKKWQNYQNKFINNSFHKDKLTEDLVVYPHEWVAHLKNPTHNERCKQCYFERLFQAALYAAKHNYRYFSSSLLYSRYQNHAEICSAATKAMEEVNLLLEQGKFKGNRVEFHYEDYRELWQDGIDISKEMGIYRQKYCACILSRFESLVQMATREFKKL